MKFIISAAMMASSVPAIAGQTGTFSTVTSTMWACADEQAIARVIVAGSPGEMRRAAHEAGNCTILRPGTGIWVHGGNALIEWGGVEGHTEALYYPAAGATHDLNSGDSTTSHQSVAAIQDRNYVSVTSAMWACSNERTIAEIMAARSSSDMRRIAQQRGSCAILGVGTNISVHSSNALIGLGNVREFSEPLYFPMAGISKVSTASNYRVPATSKEGANGEDREAVEDVNLVRLGPSAGRTGKLCKAGISTLMGRDFRTMYSGKLAEQDQNDIFKVTYWRDDGDMFSYHCLVKGRQIIWKAAPHGRWRTHPLDEKLIFDESEDGRVTINISSGDGGNHFNTKTFRMENL